MARSPWAIDAPAIHEGRRQAGNLDVPMIAGAIRPD